MSYNVLVSELKKLLANLPKVVWLLPVMFIAAFIIHFGVNTPAGDEISNTTTYKQVDHGQVPLGALWHQHNEHRIFFPSVIDLGAAYSSHDNLKFDMLLSLLLATITLLLFYSVLKGWSLLIALWWLSPIQAENWLWGFELCWYLCVLAVVWSLKELSQRRQISAIIGAVIASFSAAIGLAIWPVGLVLLFLNKQAKRWWILSGILTYIAYFYHYTSSSSTSGSLHFVPFGRYFLALLGGTVTESPQSAVLMGGILLSLLVPMGYLMYKNKLRKGHFWIGLMLFALLAIALTDRGRNASGVTQALSSRYSTFSLLYIVGAIGFTITVTKQAGARWLIIGLSIPLLISSYISGIHNAQKLHTDRIVVKTCTHVPHPTDDCIRLIDPFDPLSVTRSRIDFLKSKHWAGY